MPEVSANVSRRLNKMNDRSRALYLSYINYLEKSGKSKGTINVYSNKVLNFLELLPRDQLIHKLSFSQVEDFIGIAETESSYNGRVYVMGSFIDFLVNHENISLKINVEKVRSLVFSTREVRKSTQGGAVPLSIEQVVLIRETYKRNQDYKRLFTFEMIYRHAAKWNQLAKCTNKNYDSNTKEFRIGKNKKLRIDNYIASLIEKAPSIINSPVRPGHRYRLNDMGELLGRVVRWIDIDDTHDKHFVSCPRCQGEVELQADNWVLMSIDENETKWLVCKSCVQKGVDNA
ncbi:hypothetical protein [Halobacillus trueperi]|uniref:Core-binding (CB) domain-containing protein n=1 Tax=Halobacillus trueperi TaxID=156205 RepID=A0A3E0J4N8_9BACI|nr:hypothetical protein [Halobacillus trueperi]REJ07913.1 hypothetical protein DYE48_14830 [Halobacillus trueperi]